MTNKKVTPEELVKIKLEIIPFLREIRTRETKFNHTHCQSSIDMSDSGFESLICAIGELECYHHCRQKKVDSEKYEEVLVNGKARKNAEKKRHKNEISNSNMTKHRIRKPISKKAKKYKPRIKL